MIDGESVQLAGNQRLLSPRHLAGFGLIYSGTEGVQASLVTNEVGVRFLDMQNQITSGSYATFDATPGYAFRRHIISVNGYNLSDRREPVLASEHGEGQFYVLPGHRVFLKISAPL